MAGVDADWNLDAPWVRVQHTDEGLRLGNDPVAWRRSKRTFALVALVIGALVWLFGEGLVRWIVPGLFLAFALVSLLRNAPEVGVRVHAGGVEQEGEGGRRVAAADVAAVRLTRHEYWKQSGKNRRLVVEWPVALDGADWILATGEKRERARRLAEDLAIVLGKPFIDATGPVDTVVPADAVNMDLVERLRRRVLRPAPPGEAPSTVRRRERSDGVEYVVRIPPWPRLVGSGLSAVILLAFAFATWNALAPLVDEGGPRGLLLVPVVSASVALVFVLVAVSAFFGEEWVRATGNGVAYGRRRFGVGRTRSATLHGAEDLRAMKGVQLVGDDLVVPLGFGGADAETQTWIANALLHDLSRGSHG